MQRSVLAPFSELYFLQDLCDRSFIIYAVSLIEIRECILLCLIEVWGSCRVWLPKLLITPLGRSRNRVYAHFLELKFALLHLGCQIICVPYICRETEIV
jgi:hypothetical protein